MAKEFRLPDIGEGLTEAEIVRWLIPEGGAVKADQPVVEVETDKAVVEIPSPFAGFVIHHGGSEGQTIAVGDVLMVVERKVKSGLRRRRLPLRVARAAVISQIPRRAARFRKRSLTRSTNRWRPKRECQSQDHRLLPRPSRQRQSRSGRSSAI